MGSRETFELVKVTLQWGHALSGMDIWILCPRPSERMAGFNGAMPFQAWIWASNKSRFECFTCFNGAMPFQAWIYLQAVFACIHPTPLQWGHALSGMDILRCVVNRACRELLQWGHALSGMDI